MRYGIRNTGYEVAMNLGYDIDKRAWGCGTEACTTEMGRLRLVGSVCDRRATMSPRRCLGMRDQRLASHED